MSEVITKIEDIINSHPVVVFGKGYKGEPFCGFTARVQAVFEDLYPEFEMVNVLDDPDLRSGLKTYSQWPTFPQVYIRGEFVGGCDIVEEMASDGSLPDLLK